MAVILNTDALHVYLPASERGKPEAKQRLYQLRVPSRYSWQAYISEQAVAFRKAARDLGVDRLDVRAPDGFRALVEQAIEAVVAEPDRKRVRGYFEALEAAQSKLRAGKLKDISEQLVADAREAENVLVDHYRPLREAQIHTRIAEDICFELAVRTFLAGVVRQPKIKFGKDGRVTDAGFKAIPRLERIELYAEINRIAEPTETEAKN